MRATPDISALIEQMSEKAAKADDGAWLVGPRHIVRSVHAADVGARLTKWIAEILVSAPEPILWAEANAAHIAASCPANVLALVAEIERLKEQVEVWTETAEITQGHLATSVKVADAAIARAEAAERERDEAREHRQYWMTKCQGTRSLQCAAEARVAELEGLGRDCVVMMHKMGTHEADLDVCTFAECHALLADAARLLSPAKDAPGVEGSNCLFDERGLLPGDRKNVLCRSCGMGPCNEGYRVAPGETTGAR